MCTVGSGTSRPPWTPCVRQDVAALQAESDRRSAMLLKQSCALRCGLSQIHDGVALAKHTLSNSCGPRLVLSTLESLEVLSRIPSRAFTGPCESASLCLEVDTSAVKDVMSRCSQLRKVCPRSILNPASTCCSMLRCILNVYHRWLASQHLL